MSDATRLACRINGQSFDRTIDPRLLLLDVVRDKCGLKGAHLGCGTGDCGACSVRVDGSVVKACLVLGLSAQDREITTIEGAEDLSRLRTAFVAENGFQCGFCTTGMLLTAAELLRANPDPSKAEIRHALIGNLCRCTGYDAIVAAVRAAAQANRPLPA